MWYKLETFKVLSTFITEKIHKKMFRKGYVLFQVVFFSEPEVDAIAKLFIKVLIKSLSLNFVLFLNGLNIKF